MKILENKRNIKKVYLALIAFSILFILNLFIPVNNYITYIKRMWLLFEFYVCITSIYVLVKNKLPSNKKIVLSAILSLLMFIAYQGVNFSSLTTSVLIFISSLASFSVFSKNQSNEIKIIKSNKTKNFIINILIAVTIGVSLGIVNMFLTGKDINLDIRLSYFLISLSPAIFEEVCFRFFIYAFCVYLLNGEVNSKINKFWCYFMMIIPHAIIHTPDVFINNGFVSGIFSTLLLSFIFGLPLTLLQRKKDLLSAMIAHGLFNLIPFCFTGFPY